MLVCMDYDGTYTLDPAFWLQFMLHTREQGHDVILATMRYPHETEQGLLDIMQHKIKVIFTSRRAKRYVVAEQGYYPDIWIDDSPHFVEYDALA